MRSSKQVITTGKCKTRPIQVDIGTFTHIPKHSDIFRLNQAYSRINQAYASICDALCDMVPFLKI